MSGIIGRFSAQEHIFDEVFIGVRGHFKEKFYDPVGNVTSSPMQ